MLYIDLNATLIIGTSGARNALSDTEERYIEE